jgi:hypothetical protein
LLGKIALKVKATETMLGIKMALSSSDVPEAECTVVIGETWFSFFEHELRGRLSGDSDGSNYTTFREQESKVVSGISVVVGHRFLGPIEEGLEVICIVPVLGSDGPMGLWIGVGMGSRKVR